MALLAPVVFGADVYRSTGEHGEPVYSDEPQPGSTKVDVPPITIVPAVPVTQPPRAPSRAEPRAGGYQQFAIVSPSPDEAIRDNAGNVQVALRVSPGLQAGDRIRLYLDGSPWGDPFPSTSTTLTNVPRGTHTVRAAILDQTGAEVARTGTVTFHLRRVSTLLQIPPTLPGGGQSPGGPDSPGGPESPGGAGGPTPSPLPGGAGSP
ncbi:MAG: DUF4124 domain-containing protein [Gammaproteobacteria bacterium]|nr:DUF4124 domain-containing protein [Gammaproteobacteria bacterium]NIW87112.1 DUF4124 domain-containing protein [Gammaproteobacteria bacterium]NIX85750.1 DUF4124 domain-containing protein [Gammaproteobacteria bacterium]